MTEGEWIVAALGALGLIGTAGAGWAALTGRVQKRDVTIRQGDGPDRREFDNALHAIEELKHERKEDVAEIKASLKEITATVNSLSAAGYAKRKPLHQQLNAHGRALALIAGQMIGRGERQAGEAINRLLTVPNEESE